MRRAALILASVCLLFPPISRAQQVLSFEPGGREACAKATHEPIPRPDEDPRAFAYACAERDLQIEKVQFAALSKSIEGRGPEERLAFNALLVSFTAFRDAQLKTGCHLGSGCELQLKADEAAGNYHFLQLVDGRIAVPASSPDDLTAADADLNAVYNKVFASLPSVCKADDARGDDCLAQDSFRDVQRAWIRYRDAWVAFGVQHSPRVTAGSWTTYLTRERTQQIRNRFKARFPTIL